MASQLPDAASLLATCRTGRRDGKKLIISVLEDTNSNRRRVVEVLGISREGLRMGLQKLGLAAVRMRRKSDD